MAKRCEVCGKGPQFGNNVSHANNRTPRRFDLQSAVDTRSVATGAAPQDEGLYDLYQSRESRKGCLTTIRFQTQTGAFAPYVF
jgi:hypothetical protein